MRENRTYGLMRGREGSGLEDVISSYAADLLSLLYCHPRPITPQEHNHHPINPET